MVASIFSKRSIILKCQRCFSALRTSLVNFRRSLDSVNPSRCASRLFQLFGLYQTCHDSTNGWATHHDLHVLTRRSLLQLRSPESLETSSDITSKRTLHRAFDTTLMSLSASPPAFTCPSCPCFPDHSLWGSLNLSPRTLQTCDRTCQFLQWQSKFLSAPFASV